MKKNSIKFLLILGVLGITLLKCFFYDYFIISGNSMNDNYKNGEMVLIEKKIESIERFDVVVFNTGNTVFGKKLIKRVIGTPNETIQIIDGYVFVNGEQITDVISAPIENAGIANREIVLGDNQYFLLGDNRNNSNDSRNAEIGAVDEKQIIGKVIYKLIKK